LSLRTPIIQHGCDSSFKMSETEWRILSVYQILEFRIAFATNFAIRDRDHSLSNLTLFQQKHVKVRAITSEKRLAQLTEMSFQFRIVQRSHLVAQDLHPRTTLSNLKSCGVDVILSLAFLLNALVAARFFVHSSIYAAL